MQNNTTNSKIKIPKICFGAWTQGNDGTFGNNLTTENLRPIFDAAMNKGLNLWDTPYAYGIGTSEKTLSTFIKELPRNKYFVSDKFTPQCIDKSAENQFKEMIEKQLNLMNLEKFDIIY